MLFTSLEFIVFMAVVFLAYYLLPKKCQWPLLLIFSYIFYFIADPRYLLFILVTTVSTYLISMKLEKINDASAAYLAENKETLSKEEKKV